MLKLYFHHHVPVYTYTCTPYHTTTVEPVYSGHPWAKNIWPYYTGGRIKQVNLMYCWYWQPFWDFPKLTAMCR